MRFLFKSKISKNNDFQKKNIRYSLDLDQEIFHSVFKIMEYGIFDKYGSIRKFKQEILQNKIQIQKITDSGKSINSVFLKEYRDKIKCYKLLKWYRSIDWEDLSFLISDISRYQELSKNYNSLSKEQNVEFEVLRKKYIQNYVKFYKKTEKSLISMCKLRYLIFTPNFDGV